MRYLIPIISLIGITLLILLGKSLGNTDLLSTETFRLLFIFNILFIAALVLLIAIQIFRLLNSIKREIVGSKLTLRLVISFGLMIIIPVSIVYLVSVNFLTKSINSWFDVKVESVNTSRLNGKVKKFRGTVGKRKDTKKAIVTLAEGNSIDITTGV